MIKGAQQFTQTTGARLLALLTFAGSLMTTQMAGTTPTGDTGIEGVILISPTRGGPTRQGVPNAAPLRNAEFVVRKADHPAGAFKTDREGKFRVVLPPGRYSVRGENQRSRVGRYGPFEIDVIAGQMSQVQWVCDSGLR